MVKTYSMLCPVMFGEGAVSEIGNKVKELSGKKAFCVYDQGVKMAGIAEKVCKLLEEAGIEYDVYEGVQADPKDTIVDEAAAYGKEQGVDIVIGIGGGSSLDAAKAVAVLLKNPGSIGDYYAGVGKPFTETAPLILIPTASGTGSEITPMAVITDTKNVVKQTILNHGNVAIVDPELTRTVPAHVTSATGFDALSHAVEAYTVNPGFMNPLSDVLALKAITLISENLEKAYKNGDDMEARTNLSLASNFAGIAFSGACVHFGHCAAHELGAQFHISHGALCAVALPEVIEFSADVMPERMKDLAKALEVEVSGDEEQVGHAIAEVVRDRMRKCGIKSLKDYGLTKEQVVGCAEGAVKNNWFIVASPKPVDVKAMEDLMAKMYDNY